MRSKKRNLPQDFEGRTNYAACVKKKGQSTCVAKNYHAVKKRNLPQDFEGRKNYAACVKKKGHSTRVTAIDDSADTLQLSIFFWHSVETF